MKFLAAQICTRMPRSVTKQSGEERQDTHKKRDGEKDRRGLAAEGAIGIHRTSAPKSSLHRLQLPMRLTCNQFKVAFLLFITILFIKFLIIIISIIIIIYVIAIFLHYELKQIIGHK